MNSSVKSELVNAGLLNNVIQGDCLEVMKSFPSTSIDLVLCDLPYGTTQNKWDSPINLTELWKHYKRIVKPNGAIILTSQGLFTGRLIMSNPEMFKYKIVWEKSKPTNFLNAKKQPLRKHEDICIFYSKQPVYNPEMQPGEPYNKGLRKAQQTGSYGNFKPTFVEDPIGVRYPTDIVYMKTPESESNGVVIHPTQKPIGLGRYLIRSYSNPGDVVLDNTCGSGSFLVSAVIEERNFIGIELNDGSQLFKNEAINLIEESKKRIIDSIWDNNLIHSRSLIKTGLLRGL